MQLGCTGGLVFRVVPDSGVGCDRMRDALPSICLCALVYTGVPLSVRALFVVFPTALSVFVCMCLSVWVVWVGSRGHVGCRGGRNRPSFRPGCIRRPNIDLHARPFASECAAPCIFIAVFAHFHVAQNRTMVMRAPIGGRCRPNGRK